MMYNVILTLKDGKQYYIGSDGSKVPLYTMERAFKYEFEDYEDARNVQDAFAWKITLTYYEGKMEDFKSIEVVQI